MSTHAVKKAFVLLALPAPVAGELRAIVGSIQIAADVDRMGALALHVAKITRRRQPQHADEPPSAPQPRRSVTRPR